MIVVLRMGRSNRPWRSQLLAKCLISMARPDTETLRLPSMSGVGH